MHGDEIQGAEDEDDGSVLGYVTKPKCQQLQRGWLLGYSFQLVSYVSLPHTERNTSGSAYYFMRPTIVTNFSKGGKISFQPWKDKFPTLEREVSSLGTIAFHYWKMLGKLGLHPSATVTTTLAP